MDVKESPRFKNYVADSMYNTDKRSGATAEYGKGIFVGLVSGLMANGMLFRTAMWVCVGAMGGGIDGEKRIRLGCIPDTWLVTVIEIGGHDVVDYTG